MFKMQLMLQQGCDPCSVALFKINKKEKKKSASYEIPREIISVKNWTQNLPFGYFILV